MIKKISILQLFIPAAAMDIVIPYAFNNIPSTHMESQHGET